MKKIITLLGIGIILFSSTDSFVFAEEIDKPIKIVIYGHVYQNDKNNPLKGVKVSLNKDGKEISSGNSDQSGLFNLVSSNRQDYLNLCIYSTGSTSKLINFCETVSVFQKIGYDVDGVEIRELEHDFFVDNNGKNLNEKYEKEITNQPLQQEYSEYEENLEKNKDEAERRLLQDKEKEKQEKDKAQYKMPANTEMLGALKSIQIIGTYANSGSGIKIDPKKTFVTILDNRGETLKQLPLGNYYDFKITVKPKIDSVFLNPLILKIENSETKDFEGKKIKKYKEAYYLLYKEKNIINFTLEENNPGYMDKEIKKREDMPFFTLAFFIIFFGSIIILNYQNKVDNKRKF